MVRSSRPESSGVVIDEILEELAQRSETCNAQNEDSIQIVITLISISLSGRHHAEDTDAA